MVYYWPRGGLLSQDQGYYRTKAGSWVHPCIGGDGRVQEK